MIVREGGIAVIVRGVKMFKRLVISLCYAPMTMTISWSFVLCYS